MATKTTAKRTSKRTTKRTTQKTTAQKGAKRAAATQRSASKRTAARTGSTRTATTRPVKGKAAGPQAYVEHQIKVGQKLLWNVEGHAARTDSPQFKLARATMHKILATFTPNPYGTGAPQAHHGGSLWVNTGAADQPWRLFLNWAGIEWAAQFCCDPARVDRLRQNAVAITDAFPHTIPELEKLGYSDTKILTSQITTPDDVARYVDSIWNSCVPIPQPQHTGALTPDALLASGVHNYPEPSCGIPRVMRSDFVPFSIDPATGAGALAVPVAPHGSGDGRLRVMYAERGHYLHQAHADAHDAGKALLLPPDHPIAKTAFAHQP